MAPGSHHLLSYRLLPVVLAAAVTLGACSQTAGLPALPGSAVTSARGVTASDSTSDTASSSNGGGNGSAGGGGAYDPNRVATLDMSVRVVNLFTPKGSTTGTAIEVWAGSSNNGGRRLQTVPYGQVSPYFAPAVQDPQGQGQTSSHMSYSLNFYAAGKTADSEVLFNQGEDSSPGQKLTMVIAPNEPTADGASAQIFADDVGSSPVAGGFTKLSVPPAPAGTAVLLLGAVAMEYRGADPTSPDSLTPSTVDGKCIQYIESDTGKVHDPKSDTTDLFGGTSSLPYVVQPGTQIRINLLKDQQSVTDSCADTPVLGPVDPKLTAGERAYGFIYGPDMKAAQLLVVPTG